MLEAMTDSHCHLDYCDDPEQAADETLSLIVTVGTSVARCETSLALAEQFENVWVAVGIHPNNASDAKDAAVRAQIEALATHPKVVAIGETGFDTYWEDETLETQTESFLWQVDLARSLNKPLILHVRDKQNREDASCQAASMLKQAGYERGILHCCNGHEGLLEVGLQLGWMVSFAGNVTYKNARELHEIAKRIPQDRLLVETDSPFLTPVPLRGKRNVPANVRHTAAFVAALREEPLEVLERYTDANARRVYGMD